MCYRVSLAEPDPRSQGERVWLSKTIIEWGLLYAAHMHCQHISEKSVRNPFYEMNDDVKIVRVEVKYEKLLEQEQLQLLARNSYIHATFFYITKYGSTLYRDGRGLGPLCLYIRKFQLALSISVIIHF